MRKITYAEALVEAVDELLAADHRTVLIGSHLLGLSPRRVLLNALREKYRGRVYDPPIAELGYVGMSIGAAMTGLRPIVDVATASFSYQAWPQIACEAANARYMSAGETGVPVILHMLSGLRGAGAAQHSVSPQAMLWNIPGLRIMLPATPYDVKGMLKAAAESDDPTVFIDNTRLFEIVGEVPEGDYRVPLGKAEVRRQGRELTIVATSLMVHRALDAAKSLALEGIEAEVVDMRSLVPFDRATLLDSVSKTGRVIVADETPLNCGVADGISAIIAEEAFHALKAPILRVAVPNVPVPFSPPLESQLDPTADKIVAVARKLMAGNSR